MHFLAAWVLVVPGALYLLAGILGGHFRRHLVPRACELTPRLVREDFVNHLRLRIKRATGGPHYGLLQKCAYSAVVLVILPLAVVTGLAMSPAISATYPFLSAMFGGFQSARTVHFFTSVTLALFVIVHVMMVVKSGLRRHMRAMTFGIDMESKRLITRRRMLITGMASVGALFLPGCSRKLPPTYGNLLRMGDTLTYAAHRALLRGDSLVREYSRGDITSFPAIGTTDPGDPKNRKPSETYRRLQSGGFTDRRLSIEGLVARPGGLFAIGPQAVPLAHPDHATKLRRGLGGHCGMDRRTAEPCA